MATLDEGDEAIIPAPFWGAYPLAVEVLGGRPVFVACPQYNGFRPRPADIEAAITPRTKWLLLNLPNNPSGAACGRAELEAIASVMRRHPHVWIMDDAMYEHLLYDRIDYCAFAAAAPDLRDRVLTVAGVSKTYAMTGWRIGFAGGPAPPHPRHGQHPGPRDGRRLHPRPGRRHRRAGRAAGRRAGAGRPYKRRRDLVVDRLQACAGIRCHRPEGAFYVFPTSPAVSAG